MKPEKIGPTSLTNAPAPAPENSAPVKSRAKAAPAAYYQDGKHAAAPDPNVVGSTRVIAPALLDKPGNVLATRIAAAQDTKSAPLVTTWQHDVPSQPKGKKVLFVNMVAGDCNLAEYQYNNLVMQQKVGSDDNTNVVGYIDMGPDTSANAFDGKFKGARMYYLKKDPASSKLTSKFDTIADHVDMSNPKQLLVFLEDAFKRFPADEVVVVYNDHGNGWQGEMADDSDGSYATIPGMDSITTRFKAQFKEDLEAAGVKPPSSIMVVDDACMEMNIEKLYGNRTDVDFEAGSEETIGGAGLPYTPILGGKPLASAIADAQKKYVAAAKALKAAAKSGKRAPKVNTGLKDFANSIIEVVKKNPAGLDTLSAVQVNQDRPVGSTVKTPFDNLVDAVKVLGVAIKQTRDKRAITRAITEAEGYEIPEMKDLQDLCEKISSHSQDKAVLAACTAVIANLRPGTDNFLLDNENNPRTHPRSHGLSIFTGDPRTPDFMNTMTYADMPFAKETGWAEALASLQPAGSEAPKAAGHWPDGSAIPNREPHGAIN